MPHTHSTIILIMMYNDMQWLILHTRRLDMFILTCYYYHFVCGLGLCRLYPLSSSLVLSRPEEGFLRRFTTVIDNVSIIVKSIAKMSTIPTTTTAEMIAVR